MNESVTELGGFLSGITVGKQVKPIFCLIHGPDGVGKTFWASKAPNPIFIGTEKGSDQLDVARLPQPQTYRGLLDQLLGLKNQQHPFKTIVGDSIDWIEPLIWKHICDQAHIGTIEDYLGGFGKGYIRALEIWRELLRELSDLATRFHVILIAHSKVKRFDDPKLPTAYDRYVIAINDLAAAAVRQAVDAVLFASFDEKVRQSSKRGPGKGLGEGDRILYTEHRPAFDAKNRFNLPFELPLEWKAFAGKVKEFYFGAPATITGGADGEQPAAVPAEQPGPSSSEEAKDESADRPAPVTV